MLWLESVRGQENLKYKAWDGTQHTFWAMEIIKLIFFQEYRTFSIALIEKKPSYAAL